jgi:hypothetical protein
MKMNRLSALIITAGMSGQVLALEPMPQEAGWDGFVNLGAAAGEIETNFIAEIDDLGVDLGDDTIDSLDSPSSDGITMPMVGFEVGYTLKSGKTRFMLGNDFIDHLEFIRTTSVGVRHEFDSAGSVQIEALVAPGIKTSVYADPYQTGVQRKTTDVEDSGARLTWDRIMGSNFELTLTAINRDIDKERSGAALGLTNAEQDLLDRNGDLLSLGVSYSFKLNDRHSLRPSIQYVDLDLDGDAMSQDGALVSLNHVYQGSTLRWVNKVAFASLSGDKKNPIFGDTNDADRYSLSTALMYPGIFGLDKWIGNVGASYTDSDSDVDFNDASIWMVSVGMMRRF